MKKIWYNYWNPPYDNKADPAFHEHDFLWKKTMEDNWDEISKELWNLIDKHSGTLVAHFSSNLYTGDAGWQNLGLMSWGKEEHDLQFCPHLKETIKKIPGFSNASINLLKAGSEVKKHQGDTNAIYRCHVGLEVPDTLPKCGFESNGEKRAWEIGKVLVFTDAHEHWAWNYTDRRRIIFLFDVIREEYMNKRFSIKLNVRAFLLLQWCVNFLTTHTNISYEKLIRLPKWFHKILFYILKSVLFIAYPFQHKLSKS